jgi:hypothetical protein
LFRIRATDCRPSSSRSGKASADHCGLDAGVVLDGLLEAVVGEGLAVAGVVGEQLVRDGQGCLLP